MAKPRPITNINDPRWVRAISHPLRIRLLAMLDEETASPVVLANKLGQPRRRRMRPAVVRRRRPMMPAVARRRRPMTPALTRRPPA
jgi:hypothetical protein